MCTHEVQRINTFNLDSPICVDAEAVVVCAVDEAAVDAEAVVVCAVDGAEVEAEAFVVGAVDDAAVVEAAVDVVGIAVDVAGAVEEAEVDVVGAVVDGAVVEVIGAVVDEDTFEVVIVESIEDVAVSVDDTGTELEEEVSGKERSDIFYYLTLID